MFGLFKKRKKPKAGYTREEILANNIVCDFGGFIADNPPDSLKILDKSVLPFDKETIKNAFIVWMGSCEDKKHLELCRVIFPMLAQYQENIGDKPLGYYSDMTNESDLDIEAIKKKFKETGRMDEDVKQKIMFNARNFLANIPNDEIQEKVRQEKIILREIADRIIDSKK